ncbi:MAG: heptaprenylglyceryl phosphate synthase [Candidatus Bathyarchaeia archaeon]
MTPWSEWKHITKLDPDKRNTRSLVAAVMESGTDAIMVSGTQDVTPGKVDYLLRLLKDSPKPVVLEPSHKDLVRFDVDYVFVPMVLNATERWWFIEAHRDWLRRSLLEAGSRDWEKIVCEAYIVLNQDSAVARVTKSDTNLEDEDVIAYALFADRLLRVPIVYLEYSGRYGDPRLVAKVKRSMGQAALFYGGGIDSMERALEMSRHATIIVGNVVYEDLGRYLSTIV